MWRGYNRKSAAFGNKTLSLAHRGLVKLGIWRVPANTIVVPKSDLFESVSRIEPQIRLHKFFAVMRTS